MSAAKSALTVIPEPDDATKDRLVRDALEHICKDPLFKDTTRMKRFLRYVVEETLEGRADRLKGYTIGVEVFDRPVDFDPQADTIVRVQAGQLRRRLDLYYSERGQDSPVRILIPKGRYSPTFELRNDISENTSVEPEAVVATRSDDPRPSIAVTTLDSLTDPGENRTYFADGLTAEIVNALVQFRSIRVVTYTANVAATSRGRSVREIGEACEADFVLSGSVRRDGDVFRVTVSLIRCDTNEHLFSRVFDREYQPGSLFSLQEEIASYTAAAVAAPFGAINRYNRRRVAGRRESMEAYECVLRYYDLQIAPTRNKADELLQDMTRVVGTYPEFSSGWAICSLLHTFLVALTIPVGDLKHLDDADRCARRAISTDGQNALGYFALYQAKFHKGNFEEAERMIKRAMVLNPNDYFMLAHYSAYLALRGRDELALSIQAAALRLVGRAPPWFYTAQIVTDFRAGNYENILKMVDDDPLSLPYSFQSFGLSAYVYSGQIDKAYALLEKLNAEQPNYMLEVTKSSRLWHMSQDLRDKLVEGGRMAGLDMDALTSSI